MDDVWHDDDAFWETFYPVMFHAGRWEAAEAEAAEAASLIGLPEGARLLDFCCGPGRHAIEFAKLGYRVTGLDRTARYLTIAREKAEDVGVSLETVLGDARTAEWDGSFDAALSLYTSFGYFEDPGEDRRMLANVHAALKPEGHLLLDMSGKEVVARAFNQESSETLPDGTELKETRSVEPDWECGSKHVGDRKRRRASRDDISCTRLLRRRTQGHPAVRGLRGHPALRQPGWYSVR